MRAESVGSLTINALRERAMERTAIKGFPCSTLLEVMNASRHITDSTAYQIPA